jgi:hypothetical protein
MIPEEHPTPASTVIAATAQFIAQAPYSMQASLSIRDAFLFSRELFQTFSVRMCRSRIIEFQMSHSGDLSTRILV